MESDVQLELKDGTGGSTPSPVSFVSPRFGVGSATADRIFRGVTAFFAALVLFLAVLVAWELYLSSRPALSKFGWHFLVTSDWDPVQEIFGSVPFVYGTLMSSLLAILMAGPLGLGMVVFLTELSPINLRGPVAFVVEILAAIPSVVYGFRGIFVLAPLMRAAVDPPPIKLIGPPFSPLPTPGYRCSPPG